LIAANQSLESIREFVGADSLAYLSLEGLKEAVRGEKGGYCSACFDESYPTSLFGLDQRPRGNVRGI
jgi:amidophosphoribosyltransferase